MSLFHNEKNHLRLAIVRPGFLQVVWGGRHSLAISAVSVLFWQKLLSRISFPFEIFRLVNVSPSLFWLGYSSFFQPCSCFDPDLGCLASFLGDDDLGLPLTLSSLVAFQIDQARIVLSVFPSSVVCEHDSFHYEQISPRCKTLETFARGTLSDTSVNNNKKQSNIVGNTLVVRHY